VNSAGTHVLGFAEYTLDVDGRSLTKDGHEIPLRPQAMELLCFLARNPGRLVSQEEIFKEIWPGLNVTDDSLVQCIADIRRALADDGHRIVKTVPRRGYLFTGVVAQGDRDVAAAGSSSRPALRRWSRINDIKLALLGAVVILAVWAIVHWFVSGH
jgi:adenylate cyclase